MEQKKTVRESGIELLRIVLMLQVIFLHIADWGKYKGISISVGGAQEIIFWIQQYIARCPVYVFLIISGYFSIKSKATMQNIMTKAVKIYLPMLFYSVCIAIIGVSTNLIEFERNQFLKCCFPLTSRLWYFLSAYLIVLVLSPAVNIALNNLSKKDFQILLTVLFCVFSLWQVAASMVPLNMVVSVNSVAQATTGRGVYGFLFMYIIGAYLRLHTKDEEKVQWKYLMLFFSMVAFDTIIVCISQAVPSFNNYVEIAYYNNAPIAIIQGIFLFQFFRSIKFKSKIVNYIGGLTFGVYMIHEHVVMRKVIWQDIFSLFANKDFYTSAKAIPIIYLLIIPAIFISCAIIEAGRRELFVLIEKGINKHKKKN